MSPKESTIIWDFDNTLFQTKRFWRENLFPAFTHLGITAETAEAAFKVATGGQEGRPDYFVPSVVAAELHNASGVDAGELQKIVEGITYSDLGRTYFFDGALESVDVANTKGYENLLLSYGDQDFKRRWFESIGLLEHFEREAMHITNIKKPDMISTLALKTFVVIVNDVMKETKAVMDVLTQKGHTVTGYHFVADPEKLKDEPQEDRVANFSFFKDLQKAL